MMTATQKQDKEENDNNDDNGNATQMLSVMHAALKVVQNRVKFPEHPTFGFGWVLNKALPSCRVYFQIFCDPVRNITESLSGGHAQQISLVKHSRRFCAVSLC